MVELEKTEVVFQFHYEKKYLRTLKAVAFVLLLFWAWLTSNMVMLAAILGPGYSYTTDPANYGLTDRDFGFAQAQLFPTEISDGLELLRYSYYYAEIPMSIMTIAVTVSGFQRTITQ